MPVTNEPQQQNQEQPIPVETTVINPLVDTTPAQVTADTATSNTSDANSIKVTISDEKAPLVILFGPPACGKTMTLVRMSRFLKEEGYTVSPIRTFRPSTDTNYSSMCNNFDQAMTTDYAAESTERISFMLVEVLKDGRRICQLLEAPGEHYFDPNNPKSAFPAYVNTIINCKNRKVWMIMVEPDWKDDSDRKNYVARVVDLKKNMRPLDAAIFVLNKIDKSPIFEGIRRTSITRARREVNNQYPGIFKPFENQNPITKLWKDYNCDFVAFQTGTFTSTDSGRLTYQEGPREYCGKLWKCITKKIRG